MPKGMSEKEKLKTHARATPFRATRRHHLQESAEDYTELISELITRTGEARTCDIARQLGISHVTALRTIKRLQAQGYVSTTPHRPVTLTEKGNQTARHARERHRILLEFLIKLGVPRDIAEVDVEGMEHHLSPVSLRAIKRRLKSL